MNGNIDNKNNNNIKISKTKNDFFDKTRSSLAYKKYLIDFTIFKN